MLQQLLFAITLIVTVGLFTKKIREIRRNIRLGKEEDLSGDSAQRWKNMLLLALGQKKMFKNPLVAILHLIVYAGFIIINIEILEIILDGLTDSHRLFLPYLNGLYNFLINSFEFLAAGVIVACIIFIVRRHALPILRFRSLDLSGWPRKDAFMILLTEIILMCLFLTMNAADQALQAKGVEGYHPTGLLFISGSLISPLMELPTSSLIVLERTCWWLHIAGIFAFLNYLPWSKHLHILLAFPNSYYVRLDAPGKMQNMPAVQNEVRYAMEPEQAPPASDVIPAFGAKDIKDLSWKNLLEAYSCTECGRCSSSCPAYITGKSLSPRRIMMATRDRLEEVGKNINKNGRFQDDGKSLLHHYITTEELRACTTCNACVEACPVSISPLDIILQMRRSLIMEESNAPQEWNALFSNMENNFAPWKFSPDDREQWAKA
jgi:heterodisulfide reductase subunit C